MRIYIRDHRAKLSLIETLSGGGIAIAPCDTIYGIVGRAPDTESRIRGVKGRDETNPFLVLIGSLDQLESVATQPLDDELAALWPGPVTFILSRGEGTAAVRLPADPFLREVVVKVGAPIYSTSVNRSGEPPLGAIDRIVAEFEDAVDLVIDGGDLHGRTPSTILDVTKRPYRIIRQGAGAIPPELLEG